MSERILEGDVFDVLPTLVPGSVDVVCTSPPYFQLRSYLSKDHPLKAKELGSEPTVEAYIDAMVRVFRLVRDVLAPHATCWVNVGDTFSGGSRSTYDVQATNKGNGKPPLERHSGGIPAGNLCLIPQRLALALQEDGWLCRSIVVWHKPAPMPASVSGWEWRRCKKKIKDGNGYSNSKGFTRPDGTFQRNPDSSRNPDLQATWADCPGCPKCEPNNGYVLRRGSWRPTSSYEPILMLAKNPQYFCDQHAVLTSPAAATVQRDLYTRILDDEDEQFAVRHDHETMCSGANPRDVQSWASEPLGSVQLADGSKVDHYASFPTALASFCLKASTSSRGYCPKCGSPWCRVIERTGGPPQGDHNEKRDNSENAAASAASKTMVYGGNLSSIYAEYGMPQNRTLDWKPTCTCNAGPPRAGLVLDPFAGSSRTGLAARKLGLDFVGIELNPKSVAMSRQILYNDAPLFTEDA